MIRVDVAAGETMQTSTFAADSELEQIMQYRGEDTLRVENKQTNKIRGL
jgi:hypothetical protein